jgi:hypothetical protein
MAVVALSGGARFDRLYCNTNLNFDQLLVKFNSFFDNFWDDFLTLIFLTLTNILTLTRDLDFARFKSVQTTKCPNLNRLTVMV